MLDLFTLHSRKKSEQPFTIEASDETYEYFARSQFAKIGKSRNRRLALDGERVVVPVVELTPRIRSAFLREITSELATWAEKNVPLLAKKRKPEKIERAKILLALKTQLERPDVRFLQRVHA